MANEETHCLSCISVKIDKLSRNDGQGSILTGNGP